MSKTEFKEYLADAGLGISTIGRIDSHSDQSKFPYEPTTYTVLDRLVESGFLKSSDCVLDYGCGKGRVPIYLNGRLGCRTIGVEIENDFYADACANLTAYAERTGRVTDDIILVRARAQDYTVPNEVTACFFFNPFASYILEKVMRQILESYEDSPRSILLFFYYPSDQYVALLSRIDQLMFIDEIDCTDLFPEDDSRNRIMVFGTITPGNS